MHACVRDATRSLHREVERRIEPRLAWITRDSYAALLGAFYGYYAPLDARVRTAAAALELPFDVVDRAPLLERDLVALDAGVQAAGLPRCPWVPRVATAAELAGCLYVVEGASLGGQIIARLIETRLGLRDARSFFIGEGAATAARWKTVLGWLEGASLASGAREAIVETARETFRTMGRWLDSKGTEQ